MKTFGVGAHAGRLALLTLFVLTSCVLTGCVARPSDNAGANRERPAANEPAATDEPAQQPANTTRPELEWPDTGIYFVDESKRPPGLEPPPPLDHPKPNEPASMSEAFKIVWAAPAPSRLHYVIWRPVRDDGAGFVKLLYEKWQAGRDDRALREHVSRVLCAFLLKASNNTLRDDLEGKWSSKTLLKLDQLIALLEDTFALGGDFADTLLYVLSQSWSLAANGKTRYVLMRRLKNVPPGQAAKWGRAMRYFKECAKEYRADMCRCYRAAYDELLHDERDGKLVIKVSAAFGEGGYSETAKMRGDMVSAAVSNLCPQVAAFLEHAIRVELDYRGEILNNLRWDISELKPDWPGTAGALRAALARKNAWLNLAATKYIDEKKFNAAVLKDELLKLAGSRRSDLSEPARRILKGLGVDTPEPPPFRMDEATASRLVALCPLDIAKARRVKARALMHSSWGGAELSDVPLPGWLLPRGDGWLFVSDELDYRFGTLTELAPTDLDFGAELAGLPEVVRARRAEAAEDDVQLPPGVGTWVIGHRVHDVLRLLYGLAWEKRRGAADYPLSSKLYAEIIRDFASQADLEARVAYDLAWQCAMQCINAFMVGEDRAAEAHARIIRRYKAWARPRTDTAEWLRQTEAIRHDLEQRKLGYRTTDRNSLDYWIERLPEVHVHQFMQPGGAGIVEDKLAVAAHIYSYRLDAVWPLVDAMDNHDRLVRGCGFWRDFSRNRELYSTGEIAGWLLAAIVREELGVDLDYRYFRPENRNKVRAWLGQALQIAAKQG